MGLIDRIKGQPRARVRMLLSVGGDHVAGEQYDLPLEQADRYIALGYAEGQMSRAYSAEELAVLRSQSQVVNL